MRRSIITRAFHPIGQGAFYSERIEGIRIVYDCGIWWPERNSKRVDRLVEAAFADNEQIDILFISHFDYDHVSKIPLLLRAKIDPKTPKVKRIVMPLLEKEDRVFLSRLFEAVALSEIQELLFDPEGFGASRDIAIIEVEPGENNTPLADNEEEKLEGLKTSKTIKSGTRIRHSDWVWVPFNYKAETRATKLFCELTKINLDFEKLTEEEYFRQNQADIKKAYMALEGNINENSLFLYSGPLPNRSPNRSPCIMDIYPWFCRRLLNPVPTGAIFTGDGDLNKVSIPQVFNQYWKNVGTIQIPHHGAKTSFQINTFEMGSYLCPISVGVDNSYGHPSSHIVNLLLENGSLPFQVTEKTNSLLITRALSSSWQHISEVLGQP